MESIRLKKIETSYQQEIAQMLLLEIKDPRLGSVNITRVEISPDLHLARIFFAPVGGKQRLTEVLEGFKKCRGFLKRELGVRIRLKYMPDLEFAEDATLESVLRVEKLLQQLDEEKKSKNIS